MNSYHSQRRAILEQMEQITRMERGHLSAEYRPCSDGGQAGPYYKHQVWEKGRNHSSRVCTQEVEAIKEALEGHVRFQKLAEQYVDVTVAMTREEGTLDAKKNARPSKRQSTKRPKRS
jgi:hypothetical protein